MIQNKKILLAVRVVLIVLVAVIAAGAVGFYAKSRYEQSKMNPLTTGQVADGVLALNNGFVNCYLVETDNGYLMIDAGNSEAQTKQALEQLEADAQRVHTVLLTHSDSDHTAALSLFPEAEVYLPETEVQMIDGRTRRNPLGGNTLKVEYTALTDGQTLHIGGREVLCIATPGHTPGSMSFYIDGEYLFTGDTMRLQDGQAALFNSFYNMDDEAQARSIQKLAGIVTEGYIFTAHYGMTAVKEDTFAQFSVH